MKKTAENLSTIQMDSKNAKFKNKRFSLFSVNTDEYFA